MMGKVKYYKSVCLDEDQEYTELGIKKIPIEVEQITLVEFFDFMDNRNYFGIDWIINRLTNLKIKEVRNEVEE